MTRADYAGKEDIRIIKSKRDLRNALVKLLQERAFSSISVIDICDTALINRMTFYKHYEDKYDLLKDCLREVSKTISRRSHEMLSDNTGNNSFRISFLSYLKATIDAIDENRAMLDALIMGNEPMAMSILVEVIGGGVNKLIDHCLLSSDLMVSRDVAYSFILGAFTHIMFSWIKSPDGKTKFELYNDISIIVNNIINVPSGILFKARR